MAASELGPGAVEGQPHLGLAARRDLGHEPAEVDAVARPQPPARPRQRQPLGRALAADQRRLDFRDAAAVRAGPAPLARQPGGQHLGVVEDQHVAGAQPAGQLADPAVDRLALMASPARHQQPRRAARAHWPEGDQRLRQVEVEGVEVHPGPRSGSGRLLRLGMRRVQRLVEIGDQVVGILDPDRQAHHVRGRRRRPPAARRVSWRWVVEAEWMISERVSPRFATWLKSSSASTSLTQAS